MLRTTSELFPIRNIIKDRCAYHEKLCREAFYATATLFFYARILSNTLPKRSFKKYPRLPRIDPITPIPSLQKPYQHFSLLILQKYLTFSIFVDQRNKLNLNHLRHRYDF